VAFAPNRSFRRRYSRAKLNALRNRPAALSFSKENRSIRALERKAKSGARPFSLSLSLSLRLYFTCASLSRLKSFQRSHNVALLPLSCTVASKRQAICMRNNCLCAPAGEAQHHAENGRCLPGNFQQADALPRHVRPTTQQRQVSNSTRESIIEIRESFFQTKFILNFGL
jgi:hypothetical protein